MSYLKHKGLWVLRLCPTQKLCECSLGSPSPAPPSQSTLAPLLLLPGTHTPCPRQDARCWEAFSGLLVELLREQQLPVHGEAVSSCL